MIAHTPPPSFQIENMTRFRKEFGLPEGVVDKFAAAEPDTYPRDHIETFEGNPDDNFRVGLKLTRKSVRLFTEFYGSDIILASPLGLRMSIEKEKYFILYWPFSCLAHSDVVRNFDFLSSVEILVVDQVDSLTMQNWEHTQVCVMTREKQILVTSAPSVCLFPPQPASKRVARHRLFSYQTLVLGWTVRAPVLALSPKLMLCSAAYLRQTVLLSAYETPEIRSTYNQSLKNLEGRVRTFRRWSPMQVPERLDQVHTSLAGIHSSQLAYVEVQNFIQFDCSSAKDEIEKRFSHFTNQLLPSVLRSAVQSANTVIFVPSSLDFIRIQNYFRKQQLSFVVLSE
jgi:U3 small nucleolar RNA-associated protein 25